MSTGPYDGHDRWPLRAGIALFAAVDAVALALTLADTHPGGNTHPSAPGWLLALGGRPWILVPLGIAAVVALVQFARRRAPLAGGIVALAILALLCESHAALVGGPMRVFFTSGTMLAGWLLGVAFARSLGDADLEDRLGESGAMGALAATYVSAAVSKLWTSGLGWADADNLRGIVLSHHHVADRSLMGSYAHLVGTHGFVAQALSTATVAIQLGAFLWLVNRRLRAVWGALILAFHLNVQLLTHIGFGQAMALVALFSFPWPALIARVRGREARPAIDPDPGLPDGALRRASTRVGGAVAIVVVAVWVLPIRAYTRLHHGGRSLDAASGPRPAAPCPEDVRALVGGLREGDKVAGWRVRSIGAPASGSIDVDVERGGSSFTASIRRRGTAGQHAPRASGRYELFYGSVMPQGADLPEDDWGAVLDALVERLSRTEDRVPVPSGL